MQELASTNPVLFSHVILLVLDHMSVAEGMGKLALTCKAIEAALAKSREIVDRACTALDWRMQFWTAHPVKPMAYPSPLTGPFGALFREHAYWWRQMPRVETLLLKKSPLETRIDFVTHMRQQMSSLYSPARLLLDDPLKCVQCHKRRRHLWKRSTDVRYYLCKQCLATARLIDCPFASEVWPCPQPPVRIKRTGALIGSDLVKAVKKRRA